MNKPLPPGWMVADHIPHAPRPIVFTGRTEPYSDDELRSMLADGDTMNLIFERARRLNNYGRCQVRAILFGAAY